MEKITPFLFYFYHGKSPVFIQGLTPRFHNPNSLLYAADIYLSSSS